MKDSKECQNEQITEITIADSHSRGLNLAYARLAEMDERISLVSGFPRMDYMMSGLDSSYDGFLRLSCRYWQTKREYGSWV